MNQHLKSARAELAKAVEAALKKVQATSEFKELEQAQKILAQFDDAFGVATGVMGTKAPKPKATATAKATVKKAKGKKATAKKAKSTQKATTGKKVTKTGFILSFAMDTPAKEIVDAAAQDGMKLTNKMVYSVRSAHKAKGKTKAPKKAAAKKAAAKKAAPKKTAKKAAAKKAPAKKAAAKKTGAKKKAATKKNGAAAAEGRRQVALGLRPSLRASMVRVMGNQSLNAGEVLDLLKDKGWMPQGKDPRGAVLYMMNKHPNTFERVDRGRYRVKKGVTAESIEKKAKKTAKKISTKTANNEAVSSEVTTEVKSSAQTDAALAGLGIDTSTGNVEANPFPA